MTPASDLLTSVILPIAGGLIVGFPSGVVTGIFATLRWVARRRERGQAMPVYTEDTNPTPGRTPWHAGEHLSRLGWMLVVLGLVGFFAGVISVLQSQSTSDCLRDYIAYSSHANRQRAEAAELDRQGLRQQIDVTRAFNEALADGINNPPVDEGKARKEFLVKIEGWNSRLAEIDRLFREADQQREQNPIPVPPTC